MTGKVLQSLYYMEKEWLGKLKSKGRHGRFDEWERNRIATLYREIDVCIVYIGVARMGDDIVVQMRTTKIQLLQIQIQLQRV